MRRLFVCLCRLFCVREMRNTDLMPTIIILFFRIEHFGLHSMVFLELQRIFFRFTLTAFGALFPFNERLFR